MRLSAVGFVDAGRMPCSAFLALLLAGAAHGQQPVLKTPQDLYNAAMDAARSGQLQTHPLVAVDASAKTARVATWTAGADYIGPPDNPDPARWRTNRDFWVVLESEIAQRCKALASDKANMPARIRQLLGLPPNFGGTGEGYVTVMDVPTDDRQQFFRPCLQPDIATTSCDAPAPELKCSSSDTGHQAWMCNAARFSFVDSAFPWTRLGYTYDWGEGKARYGMSEYIVRVGTAVRKVDVQTLSDFCRKRTAAVEPGR